MACLYIFFCHTIEDPVERHEVVEAFYTMMVWVARCARGADEVDIDKVNVAKDQMADLLRRTNDDFAFHFYRDLVAAPLEPGCLLRR